MGIIHVRRYLEFLIFVLIHAFEITEFICSPRHEHVFYFVSEAQKFRNYFFVFLYFLMILLKSSDFDGIDQISSYDRYFTYQIWYDYIFSGFFSGFRIFFRIFPNAHQIFRFLHRMDCLFLDFHQFFRFNLFLSLLCSRSRTLKGFKSC